MWTAAMRNGLHFAANWLDLMPIDVRCGVGHMRRAKHLQPTGWRGAAPLCYPQDVSDGLVADWRREHNQ